MKLARCRICACTEREPCEPLCSWFEEDLCTSCALVIEAVAVWMVGAHRPVLAKMLREAKDKRREL